MIRSQELIRQIALRIEHAFCRKYPGWSITGLTAGVWESAAKRLLEISGAGTSLPVDPEMFVAVQDRTPFTPNPWSELTQQESLDRYRRALKAIIRQLRQELKKEITRLECRVLRGVEIEQVLETEGTQISALSRYIFAYKAGRQDLAIRHHSAALTQHRSCPLYRLASRSLLAQHAYPRIDIVVDSSIANREIVAFSRN